MYYQWRWVVKRSHWYNGKHEKLLLLQVSIVGCVSPASVAVPPARMPPCHACAYPHTHTPSMHAPTMHDPLPCPPPPREQNQIGVKTLPSPLRGRGGRVYPRYPTPWIPYLSSDALPPPPPPETFDLRYATPVWTDKHLWKQYLAATSLAVGNNLIIINVNW